MHAAGGKTPSSKKKRCISRTLRTKKNFLLYLVVLVKRKMDDGGKRMALWALLGVGVVVLLRRKWREFTGVS